MGEKEFRVSMSKYLGIGSINISVKKNRYFRYQVSRYRVDAKYDKKSLKKSLSGIIICFGTYFRFWAQFLTDFNETR